jgi:ABC-type branched-subunit amino acid transport system ATPase component/ABC-type branched-subunit amino acid transport system permease subunit
LIPRLFGSNGFVIPGFATPLRTRLSIDPVIFTGSHLLIVASVPVVIAALAWFLLRTDAGVAVRAAAENSERALLLGIPIRRLSTLVWAAAGGLSALTIVLKAPFQGMTPDVIIGPGLLLAALAAAVIARMESLPVAFGAGVGLGVLEQLVLWNSSRASATDLAFLVVILLALLLRRDTLTRAVEAGESGWLSSGVVRPVPSELRGLFEVRAGRVAVGVVLVVAAVVAPLLYGPSTVNLMSVALVWGIVAVSLVVLTGWGGHISLGQFAIVGTGAIAAGNLVQHFDIDLFVTLLAAGVVGGAIALLVGLPALRIRGPFLAVTTLAFAVALDSYFLNPTYFSSVIPQSIARPVLWARYDLERERAMYYLCLAFLALAIVVAHGVRRGRTGRALLATRDNERAAEAMAVPSTRVKLTGFVLAGVIAGVAGGLHVVVLHGARLGSYQPLQSLQVFSMAVIGGMGSVGGALLGVFALRLAGQLSAAYRLLITGTGLLVVLLVVPGGLGAAVLRLRDRLLRVIANRRGIVVPSLVADVAESLPQQRSGGSGGGYVPATAARTRPLLRCSGVDVSYGQVQVLFGVDFEVAEGEIVGLLGTNGAGKSTLLKAVSGLLRPGAGVVEIGGSRVRGISADNIAKQGVALVPGVKGVFPTLTVAENLRLAGWLLRHDRAKQVAAREEVLDLFPILRVRYGEMAGNLSGGEQQMLTLAQAFMNRPRLLMIDELSLGLAPTVVAQLLDVVRTIHASGTTVVLVEQSVNLALTLAERAVFMEKGEVRFTGPAAELLERPDILRSVFLSGAARQTSGNGTRRKRKGRRDVVLELRGVVKRFGGIRAVDEVDLSLHDGQILGLIGQNGAGKTTLLDCISGFLPVDGGRVFLLGGEVTDAPPFRRAERGLGRSFQDARLFPSLSVEETIATALERHLASRDVVAAALRLPAAFESELAAKERVDELIDLMGLGQFREKLVSELSTGSRRIVDLACVMAQQPRVLLLDEPSSGVAQRETEELGPLLRRVRDATGCSMVVIEHDMPLVSTISDELVALELGAVIAQGSPDDVLRHPRVVESYLGTDEAAIKRSGSRSVRRRAVRKGRAKAGVDT